MTGRHTLSTLLFFVAHAALILAIGWGVASGEFYHVSFAYAALLAAGCLLTAFLALGRQSPFIRVAFASLGLPLYWLGHLSLILSAWGSMPGSSSQPTPSAIHAGLAAAQLAVAFFMLWFCRRMFGFEWATAARGHSGKQRFRLWHLLLWVGAMAVVCWIMRAGLPARGWEPLDLDNLLAPLSDAFALAFEITLVVPVTLAAVSCHRRWGWWSWLPIYFVALIIVASTCQDLRDGAFSIDRFELGIWIHIYGIVILILVGSILWIRATFEHSKSVPVKDGLPEQGTGPSRSHTVPGNAAVVSFFGLLWACFSIFNIMLVLNHELWTEIGVPLSEGVLCGQSTLLAGWFVLRSPNRRHGIIISMATGGIILTAIFFRLAVSAVDPLFYTGIETPELAAAGVLFANVPSEDSGIWLLWSFATVSALALLAELFHHILLKLQVFQTTEEGDRSAAPTRLSRTGIVLSTLILLVVVVCNQALHVKADGGRFDTSFSLSALLLFQGTHVVVQALIAACVFACVGRRSVPRPVWLLLVTVMCSIGALAGVVVPVRLSGVFWASTAHLATLIAALALAQAARPVDAAPTLAEAPSD